MAFRRRRRKPVVKWLFNPGTLISQQAGQTIPLTDVLDNPAAIELQFTSNPIVPTTISAPMVVDQPTTEAFAGGSLSVFQENTLTLSNDLGYRLRRIVGDLFIAAVSEPTVQGDLTVPGILCQCGLIVRRVDSDGQPAVSGQDQDVGAIQNNSDPWIWRRNWILGVEGAAIGGTDTTAIALQNFPSNNADYGQSRTQVDQKTARVVGPEERLFFDLTVWSLPFNNTASVWNKNARIYCVFDYRVLASLKLNAGNRRNASR